MKHPTDFLFLSISLISFIDLVFLSGKGDRCDSPQYLEMGMTGVISCSFHKNFYGVLWFNSEKSNFKLNNPVIKLLGNEKSGDGYESGSYDIYPNGSLIINDVWFTNDNTFTVVKVNSLTEVSDQFNITVKTIVKPAIRHPLIDVCKEGQRICYGQISNTTTVGCSIGYARPAIPLRWFTRTPHKDRHIECQPEKKGHHFPTYMSRCNATEVFQDSLPLSLLVCKAWSRPGVLRHSEALVLAEMKIVKPSVEKPRKVVECERGHLMRLPCSETEVYLIVWKKSRQNLADKNVIAYAVSSSNPIERRNSTEYELKNDGSLFVPDMNVQHEGFFSCLFQSADYWDENLFEVIVYVSSYPVVSGCPMSRYCIIEGRTEGHLNCSVTGIRPSVQLELRTYYKEKSSLISFTERQVIITPNNDVFDIHLTSKYRIQPSSTKRVTLECAIVGTSIEALKVSTIFDVLSPAYPSTDLAEGIWTLENKIVVMSIILILILILALTVCFIVLRKWCCCKCDRKTT